MSAIHTALQTLNDEKGTLHGQLTAANARIAELEAIEINLRAGLNAIVNCSGGAPRSALREAAAETLDGHTDSTMIDQSPFVARLKEMKGRIAELEAALKDATAHLAAATSAYENFSGNSKRAGVRDALFSTKLSDYKRALDRARATIKDK